MFIEATDGISNPVRSSPNTFTVDTTLPAAPVVVAPANGSRTNDTTPDYSGTAEAGSTVTIIVDGTAVGTPTADASGNWTFTQPTALSQAPHTVKASARDVAGNTSPDSLTHTFTVDTTPPAAPVVVTPANGSRTNDTTPDYSGTAEAGSTVTVFVDGSSAGTATTNASGNWTFTQPTALSQSSHTVKATARDVAGNTSPDSLTHTFTVDTTPPAAPVVVVPANGSRTNDTTPDYSGTAEADSTVTIFVDGIALDIITADASGNWTLTQPTALSESSHTVKASARDVAGNTSADSITHTFAVDTTPPAAPVVVVPANGSRTNDTTPDYSGTAEADSTVTIFVDGVALDTTTADGSGNWTFTQPTALSESEHTVKASARDVAGNTSADSLTRTFTVDTGVLPPVVVAPANGLLTTDDTPNYSGTAEADSTVTVIVDDTNVGTAIANASGDWNFTQPTALLDGEHTIRARATDVAGNTSTDSITRTFIVDTTTQPPVVTAPLNGSRTNNTTPDYVGTAEANATVTVFVDGTDVGSTTASGSGSWRLTQPTALPDGEHTIRARATDAAGNTSTDSITHTFTVDLTPPNAPVVLAPANNSLIRTAFPPYSGTAEPSSTVSVFVDGLLIGSTLADALGSWVLTPTSSLPGGPHTVKSRAKDAAGNIGADSTTNTFTLDTRAPLAPSIATPSPHSVSSNNTPTFSGTAEPNATITLILDGSVLGTTPVTPAGQWSLTPTAAVPDAPHGVKAFATDAAGNDGEESPLILFTIDTIAPAPPVVSAPRDGSSVNTSRPTYTGTAEPGSVVEVLVDNNSVGTVSANSSGNWNLAQPSPLAESTPHAVKARATDAAGNISLVSIPNAFTVITTAPAAPVVLAPASGSLTRNNTPSYSGTAAADSTVDVIVDSNMVGSTTASSSGAWALAPSITLPDATYRVKARSRDAVGNTSADSNTNSFTVDTRAPLAPVILTPSANSVSNNNRPTFSGTAEAHSTVIVTVDGLVAGTTVATASGTWSFASTNSLSDDSHSVTARARDEAGNTGQESDQTLFIIDTAAPAIPVVLTPPDGFATSNSTPTYSGTAVPGSIVEVVVNGAPVGTASTSTSGNWSLIQPSSLPDATNHTVKARARDAVGNTSPDSTAHTFAVDTVPPSAPVVALPANGSLINDNTPTYSGTAEPGSTISVFVGNTVAGTTSADSQGAWTLTAVSALNDNTYQVKAQAMDAAGNLSGFSGVNSFRVDATPPPAPAVVFPGDGSLTNDNTPTYSGTAEPGSSISVTVNGTVVGITPVGPSSSWSLTQPTSLSDTSHTVVAHAVDAAGNISPGSNLHRFTVDTTPPEQPAVTIPQDGSSTGDTTPLFSGTAEPFSLVTVYVNGNLNPVGTTRTGASGNWSWDYSEPGAPPPPPPNRDAEVKVRAQDGAGNLSAYSNPIRFFIDTVYPDSPVVQSPLPGIPTNDSTPTIKGTAEAFSTITIVVDTVQRGITRTGVDNTWSFTLATPLPDGTHSLKVFVADSVGNANPTPTDTSFIIDTTALTAPVITSPSEFALLNTRTPRFAGTAEPNSLVEIVVDNLPPALKTATDAGVWEYTLPTDLPPTANELHTVVALSLDSANNRNPSRTLYFRVDSTPPEPPVVEDPQNKDVGVEFNISGRAEALSKVAIYVDGSPEPVAIVSASPTGRWSFLHTAPLDDGSHIVRAQATDAARNPSEFSAAGSFTVDTRKPTTPVIASPVNGSVLKTETPSFRGTREVNSTVIVKLDDRTCQDSTKLSTTWECRFVLPLAEGPYSISAIAVDDAGNKSDPSPVVSFTVSPQLPRPTSPEDGAFTNDSTPTLLGTAEARSVITAVLDGGLSYTTTANSNGEWSIDVDQTLGEGVHTVTITATGTGSNSNTDTYTFIVDTIPPETHFTPDSPVLVDYPPSATFAFSSEDASDFECSFDEPEFRSCDGNPISFKDLAEGEHTFRVRARDKAGNADPEPAVFAWTRELAVLEGSGCSTPGGALSGVLAGLLLTLVAAGRRRTSKSRSLRED